MSSSSVTRKRAAVSCDHCKRRRARCIRPSPGEPCTNCAANQIKCESTVPRKQRVYGSVETLSLRYRALDALAAGLFPDEDVRGPKGVETLYRLAADRGIEMPESGNLTPSPGLFASPPGMPDSAVSGAESGQESGDKGSSVGAASVDEKLIPTTHGAAHYVGPSSSFRLVSAIRSLVDASPFARSALRTDFVTLRASKALERSGACQDGPEEDNVAGDAQTLLELPPAASLPGQSGQGSTLQHAPSAETVPGPGTTLGPGSAASAITLPPRQTADGLVAIFFDKIHPNYPLFHRPTFQVLYEALWEPSSSVDYGREPGSKTDTGWLCCVCMVFTFGAQLQEVPGNPNEEVRAIQKHYLGIVRSSLSRLIGTTARPNVQALLLLQLYEHNSGQRNASWMFLGCASRMAIALGMHRESSVGDNIDAVERETRRRIWWTLYAYERSLCMILGRPSAVDDDEINLRVPDNFLTDGTDLPPKYTEFLLRLSRLMGQIKQSKYPAPETDPDSTIPSTAIRHLIRDLDAWREALPIHLRPEWKFTIRQHRRAVLLMHIYHHHLITVCTLPFLLNRVQRDMCRQRSPREAAGGAHKTNGRIRHHSEMTQAHDETALGQTCLSSAEKALNILRELAQLELLDGVGWTDVYYIYCCVLVLCLDLLPHRPGAALSESQSRRKSVVKAMFTMLPHIHLSPTYRILVRIARQFADIVEAVGDDPHAMQNADQDTSGIPGSNPHAPWEDHQSHAEYANRMVARNDDPDAVMNDWLLGELPALPWDSFDMGAYATPTSIPAMNENQFLTGMSGQTEMGGDGIVGHEEWTVRALQDFDRG